MGHSKGDTVIYTKKNIKVKIVGIHHDDLLPYYTIKTHVGQEIQTISKYLKVISKTRQKMRSKENTKRKFTS